VGCAPTWAHCNTPACHAGLLTPPPPPPPLTPHPAHPTHPTHPPPPHPPTPAAAAPGPTTDGYPLIRVLPGGSITFMTLFFRNTLPSANIAKA
jgi:hypothetical protein